MDGLEVEVVPKWWFRLRVSHTVAFLLCCHPCLAAWTSSGVFSSVRVHRHGRNAAAGGACRRAIYRAAVAVDAGAHPSEFASLHGGKGGHAEATTTSILCEVFSLVILHPRAPSTATARLIARRMSSSG